MFYFILHPYISSHSPIFRPYSHIPIYISHDHCIFTHASASMAIGLLLSAASVCLSFHLSVHPSICPLVHLSVTQSPVNTFWKNQCICTQFTRNMYHDGRKSPIGKEQHWSWPSRSLGTFNDTCCLLHNLVCTITFEQINALLLCSQKWFFMVGW